MSKYPSELLTLIGHLKRLPGVGAKSAERFAFTLIDWEDNQLEQFASSLSSLKKNLTSCSICGCLKNTTCSFCAEKGREEGSLCIVSSVKDVYAIEETKVFKGRYHVLGGLLSPLEGRSISEQAVEKLKTRVQKGHITEAIIALDSTLEGDATALFLKQILDKLEVKASRLAFGLPMGSSLDFVDYGTLEKAFTGRQTF